MNSKRRIVMFFFFSLTVTGGLFASPVSGLRTLTPPGELVVDPDRTVLVFYSSTCPFCHDLMNWVRQVQHNFPDIEFQYLEVVNSNSPERQEYFQAVMDIYGSGAQGVPRTIIGDQLFIGFAQDSMESRFLPQHNGWFGSRLTIMRALQEMQSRL